MRKNADSAAQNRTFPFKNIAPKMYNIIWKYIQEVSHNVHDNASTFWQ